MSASPPSAFEYVWTKAGFVLQAFLCLPECLALAHVFPFICDVLFYSCPMCKLFMRRFWFPLLTHKTDFVHSHDCYEQLYKAFVARAHRLAPSASIMPLPTTSESLYPYEPYLAGRIVSLFQHDAIDPDLFLAFTCSPHVAALLDDIHFEACNTSSTLQITRVSSSNLVHHESSNQTTVIDFRTLFALVFEILVMDTCDLELFGLRDATRTSLVLAPEHARHRVTKAFDECDGVLEWSLRIRLT